MIDGHITPNLCNNQHVSQNKQQLFLYSSLFHIISASIDGKLTEDMYSSGRMPSVATKIQKGKASSLHFLNFRIICSPDINLTMGKENMSTKQD